MYSPFSFFFFFFTRVYGLYMSVFMYVCVYMCVYVCVCVCVFNTNQNVYYVYNEFIYTSLHIIII